METSWVGIRYLGIFLAQQHDMARYGLYPNLVSLFYLTLEDQHLRLV